MKGKERVSEQKPIWALGLMSGTSLDGVDAAMVMTDGIKIHGFGETAYRAYSDKEREILHSALGLWPGDNSGRLEDARAVVDAAHLDLARRFKTAEVVGYHGQTLAHDPEGGRTHQIGDGKALAEALGKPVVWDFRSEDVARGGQGAPLAPVFHFALAKMLGLRTPMCFVNLGGVGNVTWVDASKFHPQDKGALLAFDTGPANAPVNDLMQRYFSKAFDADGAIAASGSVKVSLLEKVFETGFFETKPPKSLDRDDFSFVASLLEELDPKDAVATATALAVSAVYAAQMHFPSDPSRWLICGGGRKNPQLMGRLRSSMASAVDPVEAVGFDGDMLEAQAFGYLAVRVMAGLPNSFPSTTGVNAPVVGGQMSLPS